MPLSLYKSSQYIYVDLGQGFHGSARTDGVVNIEPDSFTVKAISGLNFSIHGLTESDFSNEFHDIPVRQILDSSGEWLAVAQSHSKSLMLVLADSYGYSPIFYSLVKDQGIIISDSFQGVVAGLRDYGITLHLDVANYTTLLAAKGPQFQNAFSHRTMSEEVKILPNDRVILLESGVARIIPRKSLGGSSAESSYEKALSRGIVRAQQLLQSVNESEDFDRRITLSGGVDSRLTFAILASATGNVNFDIHSIDPRAWKTPSTRHVIERDITVAENIRESYGLSWWRPGAREVLSIDFMESLAIFQSYRSNYSFLFSPSSTHMLYKKPLITVRGGGGELLRSTDGGVSMSKAHKDDGVSNGTQATWLAGKYLRSAALLPAFKEMAYDAVEKAFSDMPGYTFEQQMNAFYFRYRNRAHFGHSRHSAASNEIGIHLLSNPDFLRASEILNFEERSDGRMVKDIFNRTASELLDIPFENEKWNDKLSNATYGSLDWKSINWQNSVRRANGEVSFRDGWNRGQRGENFSYDVQQSLLNYIREGFMVIEDFVESDIRAHLHEQHVLILSSLAQKKLNANQIVAKLASALDVFFPTSTSNRRLFNLANVARPSFKKVVSLPPCPRDGYNNKPVIELFPTLEKTSSGFKVCANPTPSREFEFMYAFYLLKDKDKIAQVWYGKESHVEFAVQHSDGSYKAIAFARFRKKKGPPTFQQSTINLVL